MIHDDALDLVMHFTGCQNEAYACPSHVSNGGRWPHLTIGYGHSGPAIHQGMKVTTAQARDMLLRDLANVEIYVRSKVRVTLENYQLGAVIALAYNVKPEALERSGFFEALNAERYGQFDIVQALEETPGPRVTGLAAIWASFRKCQARVIPALIRVRVAELELFYTGRWSVPGASRLPQRVDGHDEIDALRPGARDDAISDLHDALEHVGFPVTCRDAYTWVTEEAVRAFQMKHGLEPTGVYGPETAYKLSEVVAASLEGAV